MSTYIYTGRLAAQQKKLEMALIPELQLITDMEIELVQVKKETQDDEEILWQRHLYKLTNGL